jgi:hypothetical protein
MSSSIFNSSKNLTRLDYYQMITSILMTVLGGIILLRTSAFGIFIPSILVGGGLLGLGIYRLSFVYKYFRRRKK